METVLFQEQTGTRIYRFQGFSSFLSIVVLMSVFSETACSSPDVVDFFPQIHGDLTKVIWAHAAVNSQAKLVEAIEGPTMMLEADILMGKSESSDELVPIMGHSPNSTSDLTLADFLDTILKVNNDFHKLKGIKLDFKDIAAVEPVLSRLERESEADKLNFPIWLNADVLKGPIDSIKDPINGSQFIALAKRYLPTATLSLGWTTRYGLDELGFENYSKSGYTSKNVRQMASLVRQSAWNGPITFAVRAVLITPGESMTALSWLLNESGLGVSPTLTIWTVPDHDPIDMEILLNWILHSPPQQGHIYVDLPLDLYTNINLNSYTIPQVQLHPSYLSPY